MLASLWLVIVVFLFNAAPLVSRSSLMALFLTSGVAYLARNSGRLAGNGWLAPLPSYGALLVSDGVPWFISAPLWLMMVPVWLGLAPFRPVIATFRVMWAPLRLRTTSLWLGSALSD